MTSILTSTNRSRFSCTYSVFQQWWRKCTQAQCNR